MKVGTHDSLFFQHETKPLIYLIWDDCAFAEILSNFYSPKVVEGGLQQKKCNAGGRERKSTTVDCPEQMKDYSETFHQIDEGNGVEAKYNLGG